MHETVDIHVYGSESAPALRERLTHQLPEGICILSLEGLPLDAVSPKLKESTYEITFGGLEIDRADLDRFLQADVFPVVKRGKKGDKTVDLRSLVKSVDILESGKVRVAIRHTAGPELKPAEIVKSIFSIGEQDILKVVKTDEVID